LEESRGSASEAEAAELLAQKAYEAGLDRFIEKDALDGFLARLSFAELEKPDLLGALQELCLGLQSFDDLRSACRHLIPILEQRSNPKLLEQNAPLHIRLKNGRQIRIHYVEGRPPWISSRLQDFFGLQDSPRVGPKRTPLVIHLLAPNHRAVQTTSDLAGFWKNLYPQVRRELMRRYPKHAWPEMP
jgi:ATP-dependent helicase HrpB